MASAAAVWSATANSRHNVAALDLHGSRHHTDPFHSGSNPATLVIGILVGLGCLALSAWEWYDYFEQSDIRKMDAFTKEPKLIMRATVSERGAQYIGSCRSGHQRLKPERWLHGDEFRKCSAGSDADDLCHDKLLAYVPEPAENSSKQSRRLKHAACSNKYVPWLLVDFNVGGTQVRRCAYPFGTIGNSKLGVMGTELLEEFALKKDQKVDVWTRHGADHCVVGFDELEKMGAEAANAEESLPAVAGFMALVGVTVLVYIGSNYCCNADAKVTYRELERASNE